MSCYLLVQKEHSVLPNFSQHWNFGFPFQGCPFLFYLDFSLRRCSLFSCYYLIKSVAFSLQVGELSGLLTSDLGSLKGLVSENISRDRGFRALSEARHSILSESELCTADSQSYSSLSLILMEPTYFLTSEVA